MEACQWDLCRGGKKQTGINLDNAKRLLEAG
jgi:hypothetical protein